MANRETNPLRQLKLASRSKIWRIRSDSARIEWGKTFGGVWLGIDMSASPKFKFAKGNVFVRGLLGLAAVWVASQRGYAAIVSTQTTAMFRGGAAHSGVYDTRPPTRLKLKWKFQTGETVFSSPTFADNVIYVGSADNGVYALEAATGKLRWRFDAHGNVHSSPAIADGTVFAVSLDGRLYAIDASSGAQKWAFATAGEHRFTKPGIDYLNPPTEEMADPWDFFLSSPAVVAGVVYFGSGDNNVYAVDAASGAFKWKFKTGDVVHASPAVVDGVVYVGSFDANFYALDANTGGLIWKFATGKDEEHHLMTGIPGSAAVAQGVVYFGCRDGNFYALDARTGGLNWKHSLGGSWIVASPAMVGGNVCFTTSDTHEFVVLSAKTGAPVFTLPCNVYAFSSPAIAASHAFFGTFDGKIHAVDLTRQTYDDSFESPGFKKHSSEYLTQKGELNSAAVWTGETLEDNTLDIRVKLFSLGSFLSSPTIHDGVLYIGSVDGCVYALGE